MASITPRRNGRGRVTSWRVQIRRPGQPPRHASAKTRKEAEAIARRLEYEIDMSGPGASSDMTISKLVDRQIMAAGGPAALPASKKTSLGHIRRHLGHHSARKFSVKDIIGFARTRHANGEGPPLSPATIGFDIGYLRDLLEFGAHEEGTAHKLTELTLARRALRAAKGRTHREVADSVALAVRRRVRCHTGGYR